MDKLQADHRRKRKLSQVLQCSQVGEEGKKAEVPQNASTSIDPALSTKHKTRRILPLKQTPRKLPPFRSIQSPIIKLSKVKQPARGGVAVKGSRAGKKALIGRKKEGNSSCEASSGTVKGLSVPVKNEHLLETDAGSASTNMDAKISTHQPTHSETEENPPCSNTEVEELSQELVSATSDDVQLCCEESKPIMVSSAVEKPFSTGKLLIQSETQTLAVRRSPRKNKWKSEVTSTTVRGELAASSGGTSLGEEGGCSGVLKREKRSQRHKKVGIVKQYCPIVRPCQHNFKHIRLSILIRIVLE